MTYVDFFGGSYFMAWCSLWLFWILPFVIAKVFNFFLSVIKQFMRSVVVIFRGWPPSHLNVDGDFDYRRPKPQEVESDDCATQSN